MNISQKTVILPSLLLAACIGYASTSIASNVELGNAATGSKVINAECSDKDKIDGQCTKK